ncbi:MAG: hypothetical protein ACXWM6_04550 [Thermodesulfobacteriota bacterium]
MLRRRQASLLICALLLLGMMVPCLGMAEEAEPKTTSGTEGDKPHNDWHILFYLPGWLAGMKGNVAVKGINANVDTSIWQSIKNLQYLNSMGLGHLEVKKGRWGLLLEGIYMNMEEDAVAAGKIKLPIIAPVEIPVSGRGEVFSSLSFDEADLLYDLYRSSSSVGNRPVLTIEALGGARYAYFRTKVDGTITGPLGNAVSIFKAGTKQWVDPILGGRVSWNLSDNWMVGFRADVGGFDLSSKITWNLDATVRYRITKWFNLDGGFRALYMDHETGSGRNKFEYEVWTYGPWLGLGVEF